MLAFVCLPCDHKNTINTCLPACLPSCLPAYREIQGARASWPSSLKTMTSTHHRLLDTSSTHTPTAAGVRGLCVLACELLLAPWGEVPLPLPLSLPLWTILARCFKQAGRVVKRACTVLLAKWQNDTTCRRLNLYRAASIAKCGSVPSRRPSKSMLAVVEPLHQMVGF